MAKLRDTDIVIRDKCGNEKIIHIDPKGSISRSDYDRLFPQGSTMCRGNCRK